MSDQPLPNSEIILYQTEDGRTRVQCRFVDETLWLTQAQIAELFETTPQNVTLHLKGIFAEGELVEGATCKDFLQVRSEGKREVTRKLRHYRLEAILAWVSGSQHSRRAVPAVGDTRPHRRRDHGRTSRCCEAHQAIEDMGRSDRVRACYQHCCLRYVMNEKMTNQSLRERFNLPESKTAVVSQIIAATLEAEQIKVADPSQASTRYRSYLPFWA
jgi:predicted HTH transcriptional regulator